MPLQNTDLFLVNRGGDSFKETFENLRDEVIDAIPDGDFLPLDGGRLRGGVQSLVQRLLLNNGDVDFSSGNFFEVEASALMQVGAPTSLLPGQSGLFYFPAGTEPTGWNANYVNTPDSFTAPAVIPFFIRDGSQVILGNAVEVS